MDGSPLELQLLKGEVVEEGLTPGEYMILHPRCAVCHWPARRPGRRLELHHIVGGAGRKNPPDGSNWLCLCGRCHDALHHQRHPGYPDLEKGHVLSAKWEEDGFVDPAKLAALKGRKALPYEPSPIPQPFLEDRLKRGGEPWP